MIHRHAVDKNQSPHPSRDQHHGVLRNGGKLKVAQQMANHESTRSIGLDDRRNDQVSLDEVERILI